MNGILNSKMMSESFKMLETVQPYYKMNGISFELRGAEISLQTVTAHHCGDAHTPWPALEGKTCPWL